MIHGVVLSGFGKRHLAQSIDKYRMFRFVLTDLTGLYKSLVLI